MNGFTLSRNNDNYDSLEANEEDAVDVKVEHLLLSSGIEKIVRVSCDSWEAKEY